MRFALLLAAVAAHAAPVLYTGIADASYFSQYIEDRYGVPGCPDKLLFLWDSVLGTEADAWLESLDGLHTSPVAHLTAQPGSRDGVPAVFLFGWLSVGPDPLAIFGETRQARLWMQLDGAASASQSPAGVQYLSPTHSVSLGVRLIGFGPYEEPEPPVEAPEPASAALMLAGLALLYRYRAHRP